MPLEKSTNCRVEYEDTILYGQDFNNQTNFYEVIKSWIEGYPIPYMHYLGNGAPHYLDEDYYETNKAADIVEKKPRMIGKSLESFFLSDDFPGGVVRIARRFIGNNDKGKWQMPFRVTMFRTSTECDIILYNKEITAEQLSYQIAVMSNFHARTAKRLNLTEGTFTAMNDNIIINDLAPIADAEEKYLGPIKSFKRKWSDVAE